MITVRPIEDRDRARLSRIMLDTDADLSRNALRIIRPPDPFEYYVAERDGEVAGFIEGRFDTTYNDRFGLDLPYPQAWFYWLVVDRPHQRQGVGRALLGAFAAEALVRGCTFVACLVDQSSPTADRVSFFRKVGLRPLVPGEPDHAMGAPLDDVLRPSGHGDALAVRGRA